MKKNTILKNLVIEGQNCILSKDKISDRSYNSVKIYQCDDNTQWFIKLAKDCYQSEGQAIPELFGSAIYTYFAGEQYSPYNIVVKADNNNYYMASRRVKNSSKYDPEAIISPEPSALFNALALFSGVGKHCERNNMLTIRDGDSTFTVNIDFQNNWALLDKIFNIERKYCHLNWSYNKLLSKSHKSSSRAICEQNIDSMLLAKNLRTIYNTPDAVFKEIISNKFYKFSAYFKHINHDIEQHIKSYMSFIRDSKLQIYRVYGADYLDYKDILSVVSVKDCNEVKSIFSNHGTAENKVIFGKQSVVQAILHNYKDSLSSPKNDSYDQANCVMEYLVDQGLLGEDAVKKVNPSF